jgi:hypothetical protein
LILLQEDVEVAEHLPTTHSTTLQQHTAQPLCQRMHGMAARASLVGSAAPHAPPQRPA